MKYCRISQLKVMSIFLCLFLFSQSYIKEKITNVDMITVARFEVFMCCASLYSLNIYVALFSYR
jgi:hypothetical protein